MGKVKYHEIDSNERYKIIGNFLNIVSGLNSKKEALDFFLGLLTASESLMLARRIQIAQMLLDGLSYDDIRGKVKTSNQTITKTDRWLHSEDKEYNKWLEKCLNKKSGEKKSRRRFQKSSREISGAQTVEKSNQLI
ncbi:MAG: TrpR like protein YerC/YecD [Patescibacteria group bacterium]|nr:TrpR like protein YerC/YecD [Patescibacteria group bacterium]